MWDFVQNIKEMQPRDRAKLRAEDLINLILQLPNTDLLSKFADIHARILDLSSAFEISKIHVQENTASIKTLTESNASLKNDNADLKSELAVLKSEVNEVQQYLRVNNLEVVGLQEPDEDTCDEENLLRVFKSLDHEEFGREFVKEDIDISHVVPSKRKDERRVVIVKFLSRKVKFAIQKGKKGKRDLKLDGNIIFINDHLSPTNRSLFAAASEKKRILDYKYLWTRNGSIFMRKSDISPVIAITCNQVLLDLH